MYKQSKGEMFRRALVSAVARAMGNELPAAPGKAPTGPFPFCPHRAGGAPGSQAPAPREGGGLSIGKVGGSPSGRQGLSIGKAGGSPLGRQGLSIRKAGGSPSGRRGAPAPCPPPVLCGAASPRGGAVACFTARRLAVIQPQMNACK